MVYNIAQMNLEAIHHLPNHLVWSQLTSCSQKKMQTLDNFGIANNVWVC